MIETRSATRRSWRQELAYKDGQRDFHSAISDCGLAAPTNKDALYKTKGERHAWADGWWDAAEARIKSGDDNAAG
jgi:hypothetical protein